MGVSKNTLYMHVAQAICDGKTHKTICEELHIRDSSLKNLIGKIRYRAKIPWSWSTPMWRARKNDIMANLDVDKEMQLAIDELKDDYEPRFVVFEE